MAIPTWTLCFIGAAATIAAAALLAPFEPLYDPWAWLVWGEEIAALDLDTEGGPSWKPLPALVAVPLAVLGDAAPAAWLTIARAGWLTAVGLAALLAWRLALPGGLRGAVAGVIARRRVRRARLWAAAIAALGVALLHDPFTPWSRQFAGGLSEPLLVALVLGAVERELSGRSGHALALGFCAALLRPEAWPLLGLYGAHVWRARPELRRWIVAAAIALPALWLLPDLVGSGSPFTGADRAREGTGSPPLEALEAIGRALELPLAALWPVAAWVVWTARRGGEDAVVTLGVLAAGWIAVVAALAAGGYAGLPRFAAPAGALACVLGGVGVVRLVALGDRRPAREGFVALGVAWVAIAAIGAQAAVRAVEIPGELRDAADYGTGVTELQRLARQSEGPPGCGEVTTADFYTQTALAWELERPLDGVAVRIRTAPERGLMFVDSDAEPELVAATRERGVPLGADGRWRAYAISCAGASSASGRAIAGVAGAER